MAINATNYDGTKNYKIAEAGDVYCPNLAINGDFQCNQRGETTYSATSSARKYTVDMWFITGAGTTLKVTDKYLTMTGTSSGAQFLQKIPDFNNSHDHVLRIKLYEYDAFTFVVKAGNSLDEEIVTGVDARLDATTGNVGIVMKAAKTVNIEFISIVEGDNAYPHIKEDPATALLRCCEYINAYVSDSSYYFYGIIGPTVINIPVYTPIKMKNKPSIELITKQVDILKNGDTSKSIYNPATYSLLSEQGNKYIVNFSFSSSTLNAYYTCQATCRFILTCEPLS